MTKSESPIGVDLSITRKLETLVEDEPTVDQINGERQRLLMICLISSQRETM